MLAGQAGRQIPGRMRICRLSAREKYARFCERSGPLTRRLEAHGVEWWESPRSAALYSTFPPLIEERGEHPGSTEAATTATTAATTRGDNERVLASQPSAPLRKPSRDTSRPTGFFVRPASGASILSRPPAGYNPFRFPSGASSAFSSVADRRAAELRSKIPADAEIDLKQIMADLRDLELLDLLRGVKPKCVSYRLPCPALERALTLESAHSGRRLQGRDSCANLASCLPSVAHLRSTHSRTGALYPLFHKFDVGESKRVTFADLEATLAPDFTIPWTSIAERLLEGRVSRLRGLTAKEKAALLFLQIYKCVARSPFETTPPKSAALTLYLASSTALAQLAQSSTPTPVAAPSPTLRSARTRTSSR